MKKARLSQLITNTAKAIAAIETNSSIVSLSNEIASKIYGGLIPVNTGCTNYSCTNSTCNKGNNPNNTSCTNTTCTTSGMTNQTCSNGSCTNGISD